TGRGSARPEANSVWLKTAEKFPAGRVPVPGLFPKEGAGRAPQRLHEVDLTAAVGLSGSVCCVTHVAQCTCSAPGRFAAISSPHPTKRPPAAHPAEGLSFTSSVSLLNRPAWPGARAARVAATAGTSPRRTAPAHRRAATAALRWRRR